MEIRLLGPVFSFWLELQGIPVLHASAVLVEGQAVAFLSSNYGGKTSLAATLMQAGHPLLTDDFLPVERGDGLYLGRPGYPTMRMWPEEAEHFLGSYEDLGLVHPALTSAASWWDPEALALSADSPTPQLRLSCQSGAIRSAGRRYPDHAHPAPGSRH